MLEILNEDGNTMWGTLNGMKCVKGLFLGRYFKNNMSYLYDKLFSIRNININARKHRVLEYLYIIKVFCLDL